MKHDAEDTQKILAMLAEQAMCHHIIPVEELRDALRRAAALICRSKVDSCYIVHHLVGIPFALFTKQSIKLGISLWLGVINENPRMESRILVEIAECWEQIVQRKHGIFDNRLQSGSDILLVFCG